VRYLSNDKSPAVDHRPAKATDMRPVPERKGERERSAPSKRLPDNFAKLYCPVTGLLLPRDPPASKSMSFNACDRMTGAPRHSDMCYQNRDAETDNTTHHAYTRV
jgi:hypothetical protein